MSSADRLRAAATKIRDTAVAADPGPWGYGGIGVANDDTPIAITDPTHFPGEAHRSFSIDTAKRTVRNGSLIALLANPPVALAVADLLDDVAADKDSGLATIHPRLLDLANLILGGQS
jgi:hypothetical protein